MCMCACVGVYMSLRGPVRKCKETKILLIFAKQTGYFKDQCMRPSGLYYKFTFKTAKGKIKEAVKCSQMHNMHVYRECVCVYLYYGNYVVLPPLLGTNCPHKVNYYILEQKPSLRLNSSQIMV